MGYAIYIIGLLGSIACWIMVLIKMFKTEKPLIAILGICGLWSFIWGWMNSTKHGLKNIMLGWTACFVLCIVGSMMAAPSLAKDIEKQQKALQSTTPAR